MRETTPEEREGVLSKMLAVREQAYWLFFCAGMGDHCHAFLEINGVISKYVDICRVAHEAGVDFTQANEHNGVALPMQEHDVRYLGEKLGCMFGPSLRSDPKLLAAFVEALTG